MSSYATISNVNALVPQVPFTATTTPTQAQVENFITQISARVDASLSNIGYVTPITGTLALALVQEAVAWGALGLAQQSRITSIAPDQAVGLSVWTKMFNDWIKALADPNNPFELTDAPRNNKQVIKPPGEMQLDMMSQSIDSGSPQDPSGYLSNPPWKIGQIF